jgi:hypothetical protein
MEVKNDSTPASASISANPADFLPELSAEQVHLNLLRCHKLGNRVTEREIYWLYVLIANDHVRQLSAPGIFQYVMESLDCEPSAAYERIAVARLVPKLPRSLAALRDGEISWCKLKRIASMVERKKDEGPWLEFAKTHKAGELKGEVQHAIETGRATPRKSRYGLPNVRRSMKFNFTREEYEFVRKALQKMAAHLWENDPAGGKGAEGGHEEGHGCEGECGHGACGQGRTPDGVLLEIAKKILEADLPGFLSKGRNRSIYTMVYETCVECRQGHLLTTDGPVEVTEERLEEVAKVAEIVQVDPDELVPGVALSPGEVTEEIPEEILLKVLALANNSCQHCGRKIDLHAHHIIFRSCGGPNETWNLCIVCSACHAGVHNGILKVYRDSKGKLYWIPLSQRLTALLAEEVKELAAIGYRSSPFMGEEGSGGVVVVPAKEEAKAVVESTLPAVPAAAPPVTPSCEPPCAPSTSAPPEPAGKSATSDSSGAAPEATASSAITPEVEREAKIVTRTLKKLGLDAEEARERTAMALALLSSLGRAPTGDEIINTAMRGRPVVLGPHPVSVDSENGTGRERGTSDGGRRNGSAESGRAEGGELKGGPAN